MGGEETETRDLATKVRLYLHVAHCSNHGNWLSIFMKNAVCGCMCILSKTCSGRPLKIEAKVVLILWWS